MVPDEQSLTKQQNRITKDWKQELPRLGIHRPRHLLRRVGPLLVGVCLDRDSTNQRYIPTFHVHFLGNEVSSTSLTLGTSVLTHAGRREEIIEVSAHNESYKDSVRRLVEQAPLSVEGPLSVPEVVAAYRKFSKTLQGQLELAYLYQDCIKLLSCYGLADEARSMLTEILGDTEGDLEFSHFKGRQSFIDKMGDAIDHPEKILATMEQQIVQHKVGKLPYEEFVGAVPVGRT